MPKHKSTSSGQNMPARETRAVKKSKPASHSSSTTAEMATAKPQSTPAAPSKQENDMPLASRTDEYAKRFERPMEEDWDEWERIPDIDLIKALARKQLGISRYGTCRVFLHGTGCYNAQYRIQTAATATSDPRTALLRISAPLEAPWKTRNEVATLEFVRQHTDIPVPKVYAFDASSDNELGFEWILIEMPPGAPLRDKWRYMTFEMKQQLVDVMARYTSQLFHCRLKGIGSISDSAGTIGQISEMNFFCNDRLKLDVSHGPFKNSHDWLHAQLRLAICEEDERATSQESNDPGTMETSPFKELAGRLLKLLPKLFPANTSAEPTVLLHEGLLSKNILVNDSGMITSIVDWECVSAVPMWRSLGVPGFLLGRTKLEKPRLEDYAPHNPEDGAECSPNNIPTKFWHDMSEYETTILRRAFLDRMAEIDSEWAEENQKISLKPTFRFSVHYLYDDRVHDGTRKWLDKLEKEEVPEVSLRGRTES